MAKYVDVEKVFCAVCEDRDRCGSPDLFCDVHSMPAEDVAPVVRGEWVERVIQRSDPDGDWLALEYRCSLCGRVEYRKEPYCHCGADMREEGNDER